MHVLARHLTTRALGRVHEHHEELTSTNDRALAWLREQPAAPHGALVTADAQSSGRGRMGRRWSSASGAGVYASLVAKPYAGARRPPATIGALGLAVGAGLRDGLLRALPQLGVELKWPNDLMVEGRKLGGILCESRWPGPRPEMVIGFGINVAGAPPPEVVDQATSLAACVAQPPGRVPLLADLLAGLEPVLDRFFEHGFAAIRDAYEPHCTVLGRMISVPMTRADGSSERILAEALRLDEDGALVVRSRGGGAPVRIENADVWLAPPNAP